MTKPDDDEDEWGLWWDARLAAMESVLGPSHDIVGHGVIPFFMGADIGGAADIVYFHQHVDGIVAVTAELIGCEDQQLNQQGNYELMICTREEEEWGAWIIGQLAHYTLRTPVNPGDTMDIDSAVPDGSTIAAFLYCDYARFQVRDQDAGLLLCLGITDSELEQCQAGNRETVEAALKAAAVFPYTDLFRASVI
jgi:hypothetical protein